MLDNKDIIESPKSYLRDEFSAVESYIASLDKRRKRLPDEVYNRLRKEGTERLSSIKNTWNELEKYL